MDALPLFFPTHIVRGFPTTAGEGKGNGVIHFLKGGT
jgi:hypothetical protein